MPPPKPRKVEEKRKEHRPGFLLIKASLVTYVLACAQILLLDVPMRFKALSSWIAVLKRPTDYKETGGLQLAENTCSTKLGSRCRVLG